MTVALVIALLVLAVLITHPLVLFALFIVGTTSALLLLILAPFAIARLFRPRTHPPAERSSAPKRLLLP